MYFANFLHFGFKWNIKLTEVWDCTYLMSPKMGETGCVLSKNFQLPYEYNTILNLFSRKNTKHFDKCTHVQITLVFTGYPAECLVYDIIQLNVLHKGRLMFQKLLTRLLKTRQKPTTFFAHPEALQIGPPSFRQPYVRGLSRSF
ncbi:hypothetical protein CSKR_103194 [Clonorchis sinensis]|uniref:Uncharacterized protein n=1 Tax=Clonorchis sinensis TaxID=79923 RepID=A0A419PNI6_CLOSI|nr:hypothetical protein CSKR_103194 [Clonorchis sinensis]